MNDSTDENPDGLRYQKLRVESWKELYSVLKEYGPQGWLFRGQSNAKWSLLTTLERSFDNLIWEYDSSPPSITRVESILVDQFKRRAHQFISYDSIPDNEAEWLILMQHHGAPTRLLDWSLSPNIAELQNTKNN